MVIIVGFAFVGGCSSIERMRWTSLEYLWDPQVVELFVGEERSGIKSALFTVVGRKTAPLKKANAKVRSKQPTRASKKVKFISKYISTEYFNVYSLGL